MFVHSLFTFQRTFQQIITFGSFIYLIIYSFGLLIPSGSHLRRREPTELSTQSQLSSCHLWRLASQSDYLLHACFITVYVAIFEHRSLLLSAASRVLITLSQPRVEEERLRVVSVSALFPFPLLEMRILHPLFPVQKIESFFFTWWPKGKSQHTVRVKNKKRAIFVHTQGLFPYYNGWKLLKCIIHHILCWTTQIFRERKNQIF